MQKWEEQVFVVLQTLLCHKDVVDNILPNIINKLLQLGCELRADKSIQTLNKAVKNATKEDIEAPLPKNNFWFNVRSLEKFPKKKTVSEYTWGLR